MKSTVFDNLVLDIRLAIADETPSVALRTLLHNSFRKTDAINRAIADASDDEVLLFEDDSCSIWSCRYNADVVLAPHEHCMTAHIAVYRGTEVEAIYQRDGTQLRHLENKVINAGEVVTLKPDVIHAVTAKGNEQSYAIHIYEGPLTRVKRALFDWNSGAQVDFTMTNFHAMRRVKAEMKEFSK